MMLNRCPKCSPETGIRVMPPEETLKRVLPLLKKAGMGEPEDITDKDNLGIPVFSVDRQETALGKPKYYNGKGATREQAMASGVMEAIERYSAEQRDTDDVVVGTYEQAKEAMMTVNPADLILPLPVLDVYPVADIAWTRGFEMFRGCHILVPACAVFYPYFPNGDYPLFKWHTNGIASGNTMEEAILHALFEDIERDAWSIAEYNDRSNADILIRDKDSVPAQLIAKFEAQGIKVHLKDLTSDLGIPTIGAAADDTVTKDPELLTIGVGTHLNPEIAAIRAITEVAQSRTTHKHGMKINAQLQKTSQELGYEKIKAINHMWYGDNEKKIYLEDMPDQSTPYVLDDIEVVLGKLMECGFDQVIAVDLTRPELGVPTVRMIVPGLEVSTMDPEREGGRLQGLWPPQRDE
ncbi:MAG: YcaO-related McrA-glycine thioamidation protein [Candidatus Methanomethylophilus sp.]|jgi:ribosomal protein S12 methylthiotransferase accessory factor|nr:YcaO-related McrA-glycine thioamidation protein [Methanomethylophilus sp.]